MRRLIACHTVWLTVACGGGSPAEKPLAVSAEVADELRLQRHAEATGLAANPAVQARVRDAERRIVAQAALDAALADAASDATLRRVYAERRDALAEAHVHVAQIVLRPGADGATILSRLRAGEPFDAVAREVSADAVSAAQGGLLPPLGEQQVSKAFFDVARRLDDGQVSDVVVVGAHRHILKAVAPMSWTTPTFEEARPRLAAALLRERRAALLEELRARYPVVMGDK
jgi:parvulin-like peptidyl-prolyl isomerase